MDKNCLGIITLAAMNQYPEQMARDRIDAALEEDGLHLTEVEGQSRGYATAKLKHLDNEALPFVYESTGGKTWFTDYRDPKLRAREVFDYDPDGDRVGQDVYGSNLYNPAAEDID